MYFHYGYCQDEISKLKDQLKKSFQDQDALQKVLEDTAAGYKKRLDDCILENARVLLENGITMAQLDAENKRLKQEVEAQAAALMFLKQELNVGVDLIIDKKEMSKNNGRRKSNSPRSVSTEAVSS